MPVVVIAVVLLLASFVNRPAPKSDIPEEVQELAENDDILVSLLFPRLSAWRISQQVALHLLK